MSWRSCGRGIRKTERSPGRERGGFFVCFGGFGVALEGAQGIGDEAPGGRLGLGVAGGECEGFVAHAVGLGGVAFAKADLAELYPEQGIFGLDA